MTEKSDDDDNQPPQRTGEGWKHFAAILSQMQKAIDDMNAFARFVPPVDDSIGTWLEMNKVRFGLVALAVARELSHHPSCLKEDDKFVLGGTGFIGHPLAVRVQGWVAHLNVRFTEEIGERDNCEESDCAETPHKNSVANRLPILALTQMFLCSLEMAPGMESDLLNIQMLNAALESDWKAMNAPRCSEKKAERLERQIDLRCKELRMAMWKFFDVLMLLDDEYFQRNDPLLRGIGRAHSHTLLSHVANTYRLHPKTPDINKPFAYAITHALAAKRAEEKAVRELHEREYERNALVAQFKQVEQRLSQLDESWPPEPRAKKAKTNDDDDDDGDE